MAEMELPTVEENILPTAEAAPASTGPEITLTDKAVTKTLAFLKEHPEASDQGLRIYIEGGGCSGFSYRFKIDSKRPNDRIFEQRGVTTFVDPNSLEHLKGSIVDYAEDFTRSGFEIKNPNATSTCGCGESFSVV